MESTHSAPGQIRNCRIALTAVGLLTLVLSGMAIIVAVTDLQAPHDDPLSGAYIALLLLGVLLAAVGGCLVVRGMQFKPRAA